MTDALSPQDTQATFCATLVDEWVRCGVTDAVVCPGSRSTPMAVALAAEQRISVHVHHDERAGAFTALGLGLASGRPALVLTTSGTAAVELHPAVVEAHQASVPMIVLTADRPPELHDVGAPQTVDQTRHFGRAARWFVDPGVPDAAAAGSWRSLAARAVAEAASGAAGPGPVHVNLPFREPLVGTPGELPPGRPDGAPWHTTVGRRSAVDRFGTARLEELLDVDRGVIVAGAGAGDPVLLQSLSVVTGWPILADPRSGCRQPMAPTVAAYDAILRHQPTADRLRPDAVLRLGAPPASKVLGQWLGASGAVQVAVDPYGRWFDPGHDAAHVLHADPAAVCQALVHLVGGRAESNRSWADDWTEVAAVAQAAIEADLASHLEPTEPWTARTVARVLPEGSTLVVSSSMPVRDLEWYAPARDGLRVLANRGANGIDGVVSTAVGVALAARGTGAPTVVLVGDVAFLHDTNALLGLADRAVDLTVVVVDNDGGGIFSFLAQADALDAPRFEQLYGTPHGVDLATLAAAHGLMTVSPAGADDVGAAVLASIGAGGSRIVRVRTDRAVNVAVHDQVHAAVAAALDGLDGLDQPGT
ncbi:MAG: 2-succinyl-5-enolpyruvyl-6-hydroxy-3-cyclohexene-carboxylate synthase [Ilumatobacteraceae bacterium]|nr:2-succinyl-5-enolpyruvyl-6-hydroxy-3-cyclohexene-carboxylate synthase [Ilumatobacteraceae bacterium]